MKHTLGGSSAISRPAPAADAPALEVRTPAGRGPGRLWQAGAAPPVAATSDAARPARVGYARCSTAQQELDSKLEALKAAGREPVFAEKISTRIKVRPQFAQALEYARTIKSAVPHQWVIFTVHEMKRLGRVAGTADGRRCSTMT
jgi:hypothetical protein